MLLVKLTLIGSKQVQYTENVGSVYLPSLLLHMPMATDQKWEKALLVCVPEVYMPVTQEVSNIL